jgi:hypothetical protein
MQAYDLPHNDVAKMLQTYIPSISEIYGDRDDFRLGFVAYVSHLIKPGARDRAQFIHDESGIPVVLCSAYGLNNLREDREFMRNPVKVSDLMSSNPVVLIQ